MFSLVRTWGPWFLEIASLCVYVSGANCALAQITPDTTLPNNSRVNSVGNTSIIEGGTQAGGNLFHSFQQFSVPTGSTAHFKNALDIQNIISRVTGGSVSNIDGLIRASGGANLFLINPNGIVFGQNARLNIGGSFLATTATSLKFADGFQFNATPSLAPLLTVTAPVGLGISSEPREIKVTGAGHHIDYNILQAPGLSDVSKAPRPRVDSSIMGLEVEPGKTLALVGGEVSVVGGVLRAPAGRIEIASVGSNGQVSLVGTQQGWKLDYQSNPKFGNINLSGKAFVNATGVGGGSIAIAGKDITLSEQSFLLADTLGDRNGGKISIVGDSILLNQSIISSNTFSSGNAGQIQLVANNLIRLENRSDADNNTQGLGQGGEITLNADSIVFRDRSGPSSNAYAQGKAGRIQVQANSLLTEQTSGFNTSSSARGDAGEINIAVGDFVVRNQSGAANKTVGAGNGGKINITAKSLRIEDNSGFTTDTRNTGNAGEININVVGSVELRKDAGISTGSETNGDAGNISLTANSLLIEDHSGLNSSTTNAGKGGDINVNVTGPVVFRNSLGIDSSSTATGNAGNIRFTAKSLLIEDHSGLNSSTTNAAKGGEINVNVADSVVLRNASGINSSSTGTGNAGNIKLTAKSLLIEDHSGFNSSTTNAAKAGEINVNVAGPVVLRNSSGINGTSTGMGNASNISITANSLLIEDRSGPSSSTTNAGKAGEINLNVAGSVVLRNSSGINSSGTGTGNASNISITANSLLIEDHSGSSSSTSNAGKGGEINLNIAGSMVLRNSSGINSNSYGTGNAGNIRLTANSLLIEDHSAPSSSTTNAGKAGEINVNVAGSLVLQDYAGIGSNSSSTGDAGKITVTAESLKISDASEITTFGNGGNLTLDVGHLLLLRRNSQISATAGTANQGGNGGNITINAPSGFIVASPSENSDITANAFSGQGGKVTINAAGIFGIAPLSRQDLERLRPNDLDPSQLQTNDITAISQQNPSLSGPVLINTPDVDPSRGLVQLPTNVVDASQQIHTSCHPGSRQRASSFKVTGRGGLPSSPYDMLTPKAVVVDWVTLNPSSDDRNSPSVTKKPTKPDPEPIVEATGWTRNAKGEIFLIANAPTVTPHSQLTPASCHTY